jgi:hypothetical protein
MTKPLGALVIASASRPLCQRHGEGSPGRLRGSGVGGEPSCPEILREYDECGVATAQAAAPQPSP